MFLTLISLLVPVISSKSNWLPNLLLDLFIINDRRELQPTNVLLPKLVTLDGISNDLSFLQFVNIFHPNSFKLVLLGNITCSRFTQFSNTWFLIISTLSGIVISLSLSQFWKALSVILSILLFKVRLNRLSLQFNLQFLIVGIWCSQNWFIFVYFHMMDHFVVMFDFVM